jgi:hypothetical protein
MRDLMLFFVEGTPIAVEKIDIFTLLTLEFARRGR